MNGLPYYPRYPRDFFDGTNGMCFELKGAYAMLLDLIYMCGGVLYDEPRFIAGHMNCSVRAWGNYRAALIERGKIKVDNGIISNFRADKELIIQRSFQDKQRINASKPRKNNDLGLAMAEPKPSHTDTDTYKREGKPSLAHEAEPEGFAEFWEQYPHRNGAKKGRAVAVKAWRKAIREGPTSQAIIAGALRYATDRQVIQGYAKDPATWLNQKGWQDEIEPTGPSNGPPSPRGGNGMVAAFAAVAARASTAAERGSGYGGSDDNPGRPKLVYGARGVAS